MTEGDYKNITCKWFITISVNGEVVNEVVEGISPAFALAMMLEKLNLKSFEDSECKIVIKKD